MARAVGLIETVLDGTGKLLLLVGEPGVGKTRLAQEITLNLRTVDFLIAAGRCYEQGWPDEGIERLRPVLERWERDAVVSAEAASLHVALGNLYWQAGWMEAGLRLILSPARGLSAGYG